MHACIYGILTYPIGWLHHVVSPPFPWFLQLSCKKCACDSYKSLALGPEESQPYEYATQRFRTISETSETGAM